MSSLVEATARLLAGLGPGDEWPTNEQLGGSLTGTRDDEYHMAKQEEATELLASLLPLLTQDIQPVIFDALASVTLGMGVDRVAQALEKHYTEILPTSSVIHPYVDIVFDGEPGPNGPVFVETEDSEGNGILLGNWVKREDDYWVLRIPRQEVNGSTSDGHHTFDELYKYRMLYHAHAAHGWLAAGFPVVKSWRHSDGERCFGGGWFIVTAELPTGQVSNHYKAEHWDLFQVPWKTWPPEYDGHTPHQAAERLRETLTTNPANNWWNRKTIS